MLEGTTESSAEANMNQKTDRQSKCLQQARLSSIALASSSPRRQELIQSLGLKLPIKLAPTFVDESYEAGWPPHQIVEQLSFRKAQAAAQQLQQKLGADEAVLVIGSDTIVVKDNEVLGKPADEQEARLMLGRLQGCSHQVYTGLACLWVVNHSQVYSQPENSLETYQMGRTGCFQMRSWASDTLPYETVGHTVSEVTFREMSNQEIADYTASGYPLDKAGAYGIQGIGAIFIERIEGDFYSVMGLPINLLYMMLKRFGISPLE